MKSKIFTVLIVGATFLTTPMNPSIWIELKGAIQEGLPDQLVFIIEPDFSCKASIYESTTRLEVQKQQPLFAADLTLEPESQGSFTSPGASHDFQLTLTNTGTDGADTYDLDANSTWSILFYNFDASALLTDSDGDGIVDTGPVAQGDTIGITVRVDVPAAAAIGELDTIYVTATSSLSLSTSDVVTIQAAVPSSFAQAFRDDGNGAMSVYLIQPSNQVVRKATLDSYYGGDLAVVETPGLMYAWTKGRSLGAGIQVTEIEYALLDLRGDIVRQVGKLVDHSGASLTTYDRSPAIAIAQNGRIGVLWYRSLMNEDNDYNTNIYFAILDPSGDPVYGPENLTNNDEWGPGSTLDVPSFYSPRITATGDNRFVLAWRRNHYPAVGQPVHDIYFAVRDSQGSEIQTITRFTNDTPGWGDGYFDPTLAALAGNRALLAFQRQGAGGEIYYGVIGSDGSVAQGQTNLTNDGSSVFDWGYVDAAQMSDGKIIITWGSWDISLGLYAVRYAILDPDYNRIAGPTPLNHSAAGQKDRYASVTPDDIGQAILTWTDDGWNHLYYALVDSMGNIVTEPMIFYSPGLSPYDKRDVITSFEGQGNTSYHKWDVFLPLIQSGT
ncbi:MAG: hypothetical protein GTO18_06700 [Anaerolineales bacterium]|nr:hypothetical protein [Anaerolineales bacterium]